MVQFEAHIYIYIYVYALLLFIILSLLINSVFSYFIVYCILADFALRASTYFESYVVCCDYHHIKIKISCLISLNTMY